MGRGFIALAAIIFGRWDPMRAALRLSASSQQPEETLQIQLQAMQAIPSQFVQMIPYVLTIVALVAWWGARQHWAGSSFRACLLPDELQRPSAGNAGEAQCVDVHRVPPTWWARS